VNIPGRGVRGLRRLKLRIHASSGSIIQKILSLLLAIAVALSISCSGKKQPAPQQKAQSHDLAGEWRSDIQSGDRIIAAAKYWIAESADSVELQLLSTKSPAGQELVPDGMWLKAKGVWERNALRLSALSWVSGRDTCEFQLQGNMDREGRLLLHFPGDLCGEKSLPYTRKLYRPGTEAE
jgi:hypothetical protein